MATCEPFREQLLDFVYGLCDETEAQALRAHLEICSACHDSLTRAQAQQTLIGRAALAVGADEVPIFHRPAAAAPALHEEVPATLPFAAPAPMRRAPRYRRWLACAAAAAVVLAVGTLWYLHNAGRGPLDEAIAQHRADLREVDAQVAAFQPGFAAEAADLDRKLRAEAPLHLYVLSPTQLNSRGGEVVQVATRDLDGQPVAATVTVTIQDADGNQVLSRHEAVTVGGAASVPLGDALAASLQERASVQLVAEATAGPAKARVQETLKVAAPAFVAHLVTNKTVFRPGELLFFRALVLDRAGLTPPVGPIALRFSLVNAAGNTVGVAQAQAGPGGIAAGELAVTDKWTDGNYELRVAAEQPGMPNVRPHARKLQIARDVNFDLQADRDVYKPGETVNLLVPRVVTQVPQAKGKNTAGPMNADVFIDGQKQQLLNTFPANLAQGQAPPGPPASGQNFGGGFGGGGGAFGGGNSRLGRADQTNLQFNLPKDLDTNRVRVKIVLNDIQNGKALETFEQDIAVVPSRIAIDFFPEGGDLIAGVPNRVCYRVHSPRGEPVNPEGRVIVLSGSDVLFDSVPGEGTGSFTFTPRVGDTYVARITTPGGSTMEFADPFARQGGVRAEGLVLHAPKAVTAEGDALEIVLRNPGASKRVLLVAQCGGRFVAQQWVEAKGPDTRVALGTLGGARGLVRLTAYEAGADSLKPMAERLVYRAPVARLDLSALHLGGVIANQGQKSVQLELRARDQKGEPIPTWVLAAVIDERFRTREPNLIAHFFIAGDISTGEDLDNAALLAAETPEARQALDLFLGTAGWRRFETVPEKAAAALAEAGFIGMENASPRALQAQHAARVEEALTPVRLNVQARYTALTTARLSAQAALNRAVSELRDYDAQPQEYLRVGLGAVTLLLLGISVAMMAVGAWRLVRRRQATPLFAGTFACLGLCLVSMYVLSGIGPVSESVPGPLDNVRGAELRLPDWLNFLPRFRDTADRPPVGQFAAAAPRRAEAEAKAVASGPTQDRRTNVLAELPDAKNFFLANEFRGVALKDGLGKGQAAQTLPSELFRRWQKADQDNVKALDSLAKGGSGPGFFAGALPGGGVHPNTANFPGGPVEEQLRAEQTKRVFIYNRAPGVEQDTLLWYPALFLANGSAQVAFDVPGDAGAYRVLLLGHTADGRLGCYEGRLEVQPEPGR